MTLLLQYSPEAMRFPSLLSLQPFPKIIFSETVPELTSLSLVQTLDSAGGRPQCLDERSIPVLAWPLSTCYPGILLDECLCAALEK